MKIKFVLVQLTRAEISSELFWSKFVRCRRCCRRRFLKLSIFSSSLLEPLDQTWHKASLGKGNSSFFIFFAMGDDNEIANVH